MGHTKKKIQRFKHWRIISAAYLIEKSGDLTTLDQSVEVQVLENVKNHFTGKSVERTVVGWHSAFVFPDFWIKLELIKLIFNPTKSLLTGANPTKLCFLYFPIFDAKVDCLQHMKKWISNEMT